MNINITQDNSGRILDQQYYIPPLSLSDEKFQELESKLRNSMGKVAVLRYWESGYEMHMECKIEHIDDWDRVVTVSKKDKLTYIQIEHIYEVKFTSEDWLYSIE